ncbi:hypothetical protein JIR001_11550 [Polycladomyces abyssicola]|jgi:hypothetical protein|uniref:Uncharacterized protein n=1 Tax=Polycladomyces abyssicola TaxID=1125966 RepID=A0A8D5UDQ5_9BACL|nr:hypothetical protein JIR001_11550 [Polycladomyces abyssicola]
MTASLPSLKGMDIRSLMLKVLNFIPMPKVIQSIINLWRRITPLWIICKNLLGLK